MFSRRTVGFTLLVGGFVWLCCASFSPRPEIPPLLRPYTIGPAVAAEPFSYRDLLRRIDDFIAGGPESQILFIYPGCTMLVGGLLLAYAPRRKASSDGTANI
jgi:hypothetical protein